jgi:2-phospho-L-lactate guanylyltransferase
MPGTSTTHVWSVIVPVKLLADAKSRLHVDHGRAELALAFFSDVLTAVRAAQDVAQVIVVGDEPAVHDMVQHSADPRVHLLPQGETPGLNPAIRHAASQLPPYSPVAVIASDLPCLDGATVSMVLQQASAYPRAFVTDAQGIGTTMIFQKDGSSLEPAFGTRSRARHRQLGYLELPAEASYREDDTARQRWARARRDVDTAVDLWDAARIGVGPATAMILRDATGDAAQLLLTAGNTTSDGGIEALTEDGMHLVIPRGVLASSPFRHLRPGQRVLAEVHDGRVVRIGLTAQLLAGPG